HRPCSSSERTHQPRRPRRSAKAARQKGASRPFRRCSSGPRSHQGQQRLPAASAPTAGGRTGSSDRSRSCLFRFQGDDASRKNLKVLVYSPLDKRKVSKQTALLTLQSVVGLATLCE